MHFKCKSIATVDTADALKFMYSVGQEIEGLTSCCISLFPCCHIQSCRYSIYCAIALGVCLVVGLFMCLYLAPVVWCWRWSTWRDSTSSEIYARAAVSATWSPLSVRPGLDLFHWHQAAGRHPPPSHRPEEIQKRNCPLREIKKDLCAQIDRLYGAYPLSKAQARSITWPHLRAGRRKWMTDSWRRSHFQAISHHHPLFFL